MKKTKKVVLLGLIGIMILSLLTGCAQPQETPAAKQQVEETQKYPLEIQDGLGNTVVINQKPEKIVSLAPSHTEILFGLGLGEQIVGVTTYCDYPSEVKDKPKVGDSFTLDVEKIIELQPDVVIQYFPINDEFKNQLQQAGISLVTYAPESIAQVMDTIQQIGMITDTEAKAKEIMYEMNQKQIEIAEKVKNAPKTKVFYEIEYSSALWTAGANSFIDELITLGGGENVAKDAQGAYTEYSVEALIEKDPEVYVTNTFNMQIKGSTDVKSRPGFENMTAVEKDRVEILDGNILSRPSQRVVEALELMAKAIHPEVFK